MNKIFNEFISWSCSRIGVGISKMSLKASRPMDASGKFRSRQAMELRKKYLEEERIEESIKSKSENKESEKFRRHRNIRWAVGPTGHTPSDYPARRNVGKKRLPPFSHMARRNSSSEAFEGASDVVCLNVLEKHLPLSGIRLRGLFDSCFWQG